MNVSREEATKALGEIEEARGRSRAFHFYSGVGPYFILWGFIWLIADLSTEFFPQAHWVWGLASSFGGVMSFVIPTLWRSRYRPPGNWRWPPWRGLLTYLIVFAFCGGMFALMKPHDYRAAHAFWGIFFGAAYMVAGTWWGARGFIIGIALFVLSLLGYLFVEQHFFLLMALVGGGSMIAGGLWINRA